MDKFVRFYVPQLSFALKRAKSREGYINGFYNPRRRHSDPGWKSPFTVEAQPA
ncbi:hypothetical protein [Cribrihabitans neustonicus]|uniref:hypothetical protein n=1 Tax=Cribrihabitans neustonicus TaxID=1429085 RepID=UPI003B5B8AA5